MHFGILENGKLNGLVRHLFNNLLGIAAGNYSGADGDVLCAAKRRWQNAANRNRIAVHLYLLRDAGAENEVIRIFALSLETDYGPSDVLIRRSRIFDRLRHK